MPLPHRVVRQEARDLEEFITLYDGRTRTPDPAGAGTVRGMLPCLVMGGPPRGGASGRHLRRTREPVGTPPSIMLRGEPGTTPPPADRRPQSVDPASRRHLPRRRA